MSPEEAPPSVLGVLISAVLLVIVVVAVLLAMRALRRRRGPEVVSQRQRYGAETERLVAEINAAWAAGDGVRLSELVSVELLAQWLPRLGSGETGLDRVQARFVGRELPDGDEEDRVVMHVRARRIPAA